ncbi:protein FAM151B-like [Saccoglossus kowalevskii]|uniref:Protein FAM151B-like n=1 Tax=Saccoglossus kowalevskii TaxID=10224 RepID=A0ABM0GUB8_SACKO|nr:PREDICTED: protein FAM151B-like [Saccoglossus kowalevskii]
MDYVREDGLSLTWAHAVNSNNKLYQALKSDVIMVEADIILDKSGEPIMAHPPATVSDITLESWLDKLLSTDKGMKLDFKELASVESSLQLVKQQQARLKNRWLWLNADIVEAAPGHPAVDAHKFIDLCTKYFPSATLSVGWNLQKGINYEYTWGLIFDMMQYVNEIQQNVTFPVAAALVCTSLKQLLWLLGVKETFTLTLWSHPDHPIDTAALVYLRNHSNTNRIFYDLSEEQMRKFKEAIQNSPPEGAVQQLCTHGSWDKCMWQLFESEGSSRIFSSTEGMGISGNGCHSYIQSVERPTENEVSLTITGNIEMIMRSDQLSEDSSFNLYILTSGVKDMQIHDGVKVDIGCHGSCCLSDSSTGRRLSHGLVPIRSQYKFVITSNFSTKDLSIEFDTENEKHRLCVSLSDVGINNYCVVAGKTGNVDIMLHDLSIKFS